MRDLDIRTALKYRLNIIHRNESDTLIVDELGLCEGDVRVDVAVINGSIIGFEIKSEQDTLERLPHQQETYSKVFDAMTIIANESHLEKIQEMVPEWWEIQQAVTQNGEVCFEILRPGTPNPEADPAELVKLLWRDEALSILHEQNLDKGLKSKPRRVLWAALAENIPAAELNAIVRRALKDRKGWRSAWLRTPYDERSQPFATS